MPLIGAVICAFAFFDFVPLSLPPAIERQFCTRCSALLHATACSVSVGLLPPCETSIEPPMTTRFGTSCAMPKRFTTEVAGSLPIRSPPTARAVRLRERRATVRRQRHHAAGDAHQALVHCVFPDGMPRAAAPPGLHRLRVRSRVARDPGQELSRQRMRRDLHRVSILGCVALLVAAELGIERRLCVAAVLAAERACQRESLRQLLSAGETAGRVHLPTVDPPRDGEGKKSV